MIIYDIDQALNYIKASSDSQLLAYKLRLFICQIDCIHIASNAVQKEIQACFHYFIEGDSTNIEFGTPKGKKKQKTNEEWLLVDVFQVKWHICWESFYKYSLI